MTSRLVDLNAQKTTSGNETNEKTDASFQYVINEYYLIIWAFLFKHDYGFRVRSNLEKKVSSVVR